MAPVGQTDWSRYDPCTRCGASTGEACVRLDGAISRSMLTPWPHDGRPPRTGDPVVNRIVDKLYGDESPGALTRDELRNALHADTLQLRETLGEAFHTALRKVTDSSEGTAAYRAIDDMDELEWDRVLRFVVEGLSGGDW